MNVFVKRYTWGYLESEELVKKRELPKLHLEKVDEATILPDDFQKYHYYGPDVNGGNYEYYYSLFRITLPSYEKLYLIIKTSSREAFSDSELNIITLHIDGEEFLIGDTFLPEDEIEIFRKPSKAFKRWVEIKEEEEGKKEEYEEWLRSDC